MPETDTDSSREWRRYWIFQAEPSEFDLRAALSRGGRDVWKLSRFRNTIQSGDVVYLWMAGRDAGIYGWAQVVGGETGEATIEESMSSQKETSGAVTDERPGIEIGYRQRFHKPILKDRLTGEPGKFRALTILRNPQGTNFRVTPIEAQALNQIIIETNEASPPDPKMLGSDLYPAQALLDYRFSGTPIRLLNAAARLVSDGYAKSVDPQLLIDLVVELSRITPTSRPDATRFVRQKIAIRPRAKSRVSDIPWPDIPRHFDLDSLMGERTRINRHTLLTIEAARQIAVRTTKRERVSLRHLIGAMLASDYDEVRGAYTSIIGSLGPDMSPLRTQFLSFVEEQWTDDNLDAWRRILTAERPSETGMRAYENLVAKVTADAEIGIDMLGITREVNALASIVAVKDIEPPIAIGLFGDWGSGKTFFMNRMYDRVEEIAKASARSTEEGPNAYCQKVVQIRFNAWHYVESNLWASLVDHIFRELKKAVKGDAECKKQFDALMNQLGLAKQQMLAMREKIEAAKRKLRAAARKRRALLTAKKTVQGKADAEIERKVLDDVSDDEWRKKLTDEASNLEEVFGVEGLGETLTKAGSTARSILDTMAEAGLVANRAENLWRSLVAGRFDKRTWIWIAALSAAVIVGGGLVIWKVDQKTLSTAMTAVGELAAVTGVAVGWTRERLRRASKVLDTVEGLQNQIKTKVEEAETERENRIASLEAEMEQLNAEFLASEQGLKEALEEFGRVTAELNATTPERIVQFIAERADTEDYRKHLGLLAMVRQDFEKLHGLMAEERIAETGRYPTVDRIVLYIDDLDRCPPKRVVEVLQAIHLLLAYPLFMVVVGVDSRWVSRSLKERYPFLIHAGGDNGAKETLSDPFAATTRDYLEKIFQIPFWLRPIDAARASDLIEHLVEADRPSSETGPDQVGRRPGAGPAGVSGVTDQAGQMIQDDSVEDEEPSFRAQAVIEKEAPDLNPRALTLTEDEITFMTVLAGIVGRSPRTVKRFINIYRILKASDPRSQMAGFAEGDCTFRVPMFLLGVLTGRPRQAEIFFEHIRKAKVNDTLLDLMPMLRNAPKDADQTEKDEWRAFYENLKKFPEEHKEAIRGKDLKQWLPDICRFGYRQWRG
jgi:hypothetical protein